MRDVVQVVSMFLSIGILVGVWWRGRRYHEQAREWYVFIFIGLISLAFYTSVLIDQVFPNFMDATNVSAVRALAILIALFLHVLLLPRRITL